MNKPFHEQVADELLSARRHHKNLNSLHEGYAVILEELDEVWEEVKKRKEHRRDELIVHELVQVATMAQRTAEDVLGVGR